MTESARSPIEIERRDRARRDPRLYVRQALRELHPYTLDQVEAAHKLDQNEVPWDLPRRLKRLAIERLEARTWAHYPDFHSDRLRGLLAEHCNWSADGVLVGNGSSELLGVVLDAISGPGAVVLGALPSFGLYELFVRRAGASTHFLPPRADLKLPIDELRAEIERDPTRPLLLCSPNNPTGDAATPEQIASLLDRLEAPLLLDNAYAEFCRYDYRPLLDHYPHLIVSRTLSKAWSLAGLRLGYVLADPRFVDQLIKVKLPYNLGHAAAVIGEVSLEHPEHARRCVALLIGRRDQWIDMLRGLGLEVLPSEGNFLLVRSEYSAAIRTGLGECGILVREMGHYPGLAGCVRFAVGDGRALRATKAALISILRQAKDDSAANEEPA